MSSYKPFLAFVTASACSLVNLKNEKICHSTGVAALKLLLQTAVALHRRSRTLTNIHTHTCTQTYMQTHSHIFTVPHTHTDFHAGTPTHTDTHSR